MEYKGYVIRESTGHGKACKGQKYRSSIQVISGISDHGYMLLKAFPYIYHSQIERQKAIKKAKDFIDGKSIENQEANAQEREEQAESPQTG